MDITSELSKRLKQYLSWNKCRVDCFAKMVVALLTVKTVNLTEWAQVFFTQANPDSAYMRIKRFFRYFDFDGNMLAKFIFNLFGFAGSQWYLTLDRTNWGFGCCKINFFVLAVVYKGIAIPLMWTLLDNKGGSSSSQDRIVLIERFISCFGRDAIAGILADREFIGKSWFEYLFKKKVPFFIRIQWNHLITSTGGRLVNAWQLFTGLNKGESRILQGKRKILGLELNIAGLRCDDGNLLIVATTEAAENAIEIYSYRWEIETLFGCLKTRGFNLEDTHITRLDRLEKLMGVLAVAFCWAHKIGEWQNDIKPIKIKNHGRKAISLFRNGLNRLRRTLWNKQLTRTEIIRLLNMFFEPLPGDQAIKRGVAL